MDNNIVVIWHGSYPVHICCHSAVFLTMSTGYLELQFHRNISCTLITWYSSTRGEKFITIAKAMEEIKNYS